MPNLKILPNELGSFIQILSIILIIQSIFKTVIDQPVYRSKEVSYKDTIEKLTI